MRKEERLLNALNDVDDELIIDAGETRHASHWGRKVALAADEHTQFLPWKPITALIACLAVVVGLFSGGFGGGVGGGADDGLEYDIYAGPVMPMTLAAPAQGLTAQRDVTYDFAYYGETTHEINRVHADVTDSYTMTNSTDEDMTVEAVYPFKAKLQDKELIVPRITVDGERAQTTLTVGGDLRNGGLMDCGEKLIAALEDGSYWEKAFGVGPVPDMPCIVYRIGDLDYDGEVIGEEITLEFGFPVDLEKTKVLMYGVKALRHETKEGRLSARMGLEYKIGNKAGYVILMGEDIESYTLQGYSTMQCEEGTEVDGFTAEVTRTETTFGEWLASEVDWAYWYRVYNDGTDLCIAYELGQEQLQRYAAEQLTEAEVINPIADGSIVMLDDFISSALYADRVLYRSFPVTIPAGESVTVSAELVKYGSVSQMGKSKNDCEGYDLMTSLGSVLSITEQTVRTVNTDGAELIANNFGFDWENGITEVTLDPDVEYYWMKLRKQ